MAEFNVNIPFTTKEYMIHSGHGDLVDDQVSLKKAADALRAQGFIKRYHKRAHRWSRNWYTEPLSFAKL